MIEKKCLKCGKEFTVRDSWERVKYCSYKCYWETKKGKPWFAKDYSFPSGDKHYLWKGDKASYSAIHQWMVRKYGKAYLCEECGMEKPPEGKGIKRRYFHWANISHKYLRKRSDWKQLCYSCHKKFDNKHRKSQI